MVVAVGVAVLVIAFALGAMRSERRLEGSNLVGVGQFVVFVQPGQVLCQHQPALPAGIGSLRMTIGTYGKPGPELRTSVQTMGGTRVPVGKLAAGWKEGPIDVPLGAAPRRPLSDARVCIANRSGVRLAFAGARVARSAAARVGGRATTGRVGLQYVRAKRQSPWTLAGRISDRMAVGRGLWDGVAPWVVIALVLLAGSGAVRALLASGERA